MIIFNALKRSCSAFVPWRRQVLDNGSLRRMCSKPTDRSSEPHTNHTTPVVPADHGFRVPGYKPTDFDKKILIWSGRFKNKEQIPEQISFVMIDTARNRVRVKVCYVMIAMTVISCLGMVYLGKQHNPIELQLQLTAR
ncbi:protein FAM162B isoform X2 [Conger conger]|uniref:protein FAM162B isoform X2 n=1 Tax=Conger conger TaxID=82655 RepID=UPI002A59BC2C|nr:protein FAM162B isoform X2 [Conger conger]